MTRPTLPRLRLQLLTHGFQADEEIRAHCLDLIGQLSVGTAAPVRAVAIIDQIPDENLVKLRIELSDGTRLKGESQQPGLEEALEVACERVQDEWSRNEMEDLSDEMNRGRYESWRV